MVFFSVAGEPDCCSILLPIIYDWVIAEESDINRGEHTRSLVGGNHKCMFISNILRVGIAIGVDVRPSFSKPGNNIPVPYGLSASINNQQIHGWH